MSTKDNPRQITEIKAAHEDVFLYHCHASHSSFHFFIHFFHSRKMPSSEIDDIFAGKAKGKGKTVAVSTPSASTSVLPTQEVKKKKKKRKRVDNKVGDAEETTSPAPVVPPSKKKKVPETIIDPSLPSAPSKPPPATTSSSSKKKKKMATSSARDDEGFADSRGTGPRKRTEEGWSVFKEAELGIDVEAGGTCDFNFGRWRTVVIGGSQGHLCVRLIAIVVSALFQHGEFWMMLISFFQVFDMHVHISTMGYLCSIDSARMRIGVLPRPLRSLCGLTVVAEVKRRPRLTPACSYCSSSRRSFFQSSLQQSSDFEWVQSPGAN
jgi:hypothetical protein